MLTRSFGGKGKSKERYKLCNPLSETGLTEAASPT